MDDPKELHPYRETGGAVLFETDAEWRKRQRERNEIEQHEFNRQQVKLSSRNFWTQICLAAVAVVGLGTTLYGVYQARISAKAAASAVSVAQQTLDEMRNGSGAQDTHTLALQAIAQAKTSQKLATATSRQAAASQVSAAASRDLAQSNREFSERSLKLLADEASALKDSASQAQASLEFSKESASQTIEVMRKQANAATAAAEGMRQADLRGREQFAESERPTLLTTFKSKPMTGIDSHGNVYVILQVTVKNIGKTAALGVVQRIQVIPHRFRLDAAQKELSDTCTVNKFGFELPGIAVPPSEEKELVDSSLSNGSDVVASSIASNQTMHVAVLQLATCISYKDRFTDTAHRTAELFDFSLVLNSEDLKAIHKLKGTQRQYIVPASHIIFRSQTLATGIVD